MDWIKIGNQTWSSENLKVTHFRNGELIPFINDAEQWANQTDSAYCHGIDSNHYLYNFWTIIDSRNIAPIGWRVPTESDWDELISFIGNKDIAGYKLKSETGWEFTVMNPDSNENEIFYFNGTNEYGFNGIPTGFKHMNGLFASDLLAAYFLPESIDDDLAKYIFLFHGNELGKGGMWKKDGFPIRLIKE